jgi:regulator of replication initiation timing
MTKVDVFAVENFESKLNRLMSAHTQLLAENATLREQLDLQSVELTKAHEQYARLEKSYSDLKQTKIISASDSEVRETQRRLLKLVREVDRCIALLNASEQKDDML